MGADDQMMEGVRELKRKGPRHSWISLCMKGEEKRKCGSNDEQAFIFPK